MPATEGLDLPCEEFEFFFQHYVLLISPYYLLVRQNFIHLKAATLSSFVFANWAIFMLHWAIFSVRKSMQRVVNYVIVSIGDNLIYMFQIAIRSLLSS